MRRCPALLLALLPLLVWSAEATVTITNPLNLTFPADLMHADVAGAFTGEVTARVGEALRPAQIEPGAAPAGTTRVWFVATVLGKEPTVITVADGSAPSALTISEATDAYEIDNGVYRFRVPRYAGVYAGGKPISALPPVLGGVRTSDASGGFWGRAWFEGEARVSEATTEILARGPVFTLVRVRMRFAEVPAADGVGGNVDRAPPAAAWPPTERGAFYEATLRFVVGDAWIEVNEQYHLPQAATYVWEVKEGLAPDTAMWVRWFGYEAFGGNIDMHWAPLEPQPKQRGPFVALRPRWSQMPGGGQDFLVTRGGKPPRHDREGKLLEPADAGYAPTQPALGVVATHPSRWIDPYAQTIGCYAENRDTARMRFPLGSGSRAYAVLCGPRDRFDGTGKLNDQVRRHVDWTLEKQHHDYVLEWPRDPAKAGPHILISREELAQLQADWKAGRDTPETAVVKEKILAYEKLKALDQEITAREALAKGGDAAAKAHLERTSDETKKVRKELGGKDIQLLRLIVGDAPDKPRLPTAELWLQRRYQDDFLNPTGQTRKVKDGFPTADLFNDGAPLGGPAQAAIGYIFSDPDQWPGWMNGWGPGNPNFHTDKYQVAIYAAAAMLDHPHAQRWLDYGKREFDGDVGRVLLPPDGVGYECPGYSMYSLGMQLELARIFANCGFGNPVAENPLFKRTGTWHRHLLTPPDVRLGLRHQAPIGDTHRWGANEGAVFGALAKFYRKADPAFASEMMAVWNIYHQQGMKGSLMEDLIALDRSLKPTPLDQLDWGSHAWHGFGAILRSRFGTPDETFVSVKAGPAHGHYHNDELSYHFYGAGRPLSLDYNCSYHPRGDHAGLHNSMTFGLARPFTHAGDEKPVDALEQLSGGATVGAFTSSAALDVVVAERAGDRLLLTPLYPEHAKFQYGYPSRVVERIVHRRFTGLVKHPVGSRLRDYLVVRDETRSREAQQLNIHVLARDATVDGDLIRCPGQWDVDALIFLAQASKPEITVHRWWYFDEWMSGPDQWGSPDERTQWARKIHDSDGAALIPPVGYVGKWTVGEYQKWLRIRTAPGTPILWLLYPQKHGEPAPTFTRLAGGGGVAVELGGEREEVYLGSAAVAGVAGCAVVRRGGVDHVALPLDAVPALGDLAGRSAPARIVDDASPAARAP